MICGLPKTKDGSSVHDIFCLSVLFMLIYRNLYTYVQWWKKYSDLSHPAWTLCVFWSFYVLVFFGVSWFALLFSPSGHMGFLVIFGWWVWTAFCCLAWCVVYFSLGS